MSKQGKAGKPFEESRITYKKPRKVRTSDQLIHDEVFEMLNGCISEPHSILTRCSIAKKRPLPGKYDDESPSPKPIISFVRNALGKSRCIRCLMAPQRKIKDEGVEVKTHDIFAYPDLEGARRSLNQRTGKRKSTSRTFYAKAGCDEVLFSGHKIVDRYQ